VLVGYSVQRNHRNLHLLNQIQFCNSTIDPDAGGRSSRVQSPNLVNRDVARILSLGGLKPMASAEREPITGVWGQSPQRGPGAEPLVGGQEGEAPMKLKGF